MVQVVQAVVAEKIFQPAQGGFIAQYARAKHGLEGGGGSDSVCGGGQWERIGERSVENYLLHGTLGEKIFGAVGRSAV